MDADIFRGTKYWVHFGVSNSVSTENMLSHNNYIPNPNPNPNHEKVIPLTLTLALNLLPVHRIQEGQKDTDFITFEDS